ncbi:hypothetical protein WA026_023309 [Henosepilachna vigintioctopunctata]|uniref:Protein-lysine N-methyltransferase WA026_023309 n=1 Tax=Henosepilachna vigintioctopunctata TaxID=420089 RepID=A0AAW1UP63_9CUCU
MCNNSNLRFKNIKKKIEVKMNEIVEELNTSELGTKQFWEQRYIEEIENFNKFGDPGEIWFGEDSAERVINWIVCSNIKESKILDIGCGNGMFLIELAREGFTNLFGTDYSQNAINLAKAIAHKQDFSWINYCVKDILAEEFNHTFDIIHDKGTYDAICLNENPKDAREKYTNIILKSLNKDGYFIITSCNWTKDELNMQFKSKFTPVEIIPTPQFKFGGKVGHLVTTVIYKTI